MFVTRKDKIFEIKIILPLSPGPDVQTCAASHVVEVYGLPRMDSQEDEAIQLLFHLWRLH